MKSLINLLKNQEHITKLHLEDLTTDDNDFIFIADIIKLNIKLEVLSIEF
jgi:hypothetical protein